MKGRGDDLFVTPVGRTDTVYSPLLVSANDSSRKGRQERKGTVFAIVLSGNLQLILSLHYVFAAQNKRTNEIWLHTEVDT